MPAESRLHGVEIFGVEVAGCCFLPMLPGRLSDAGGASLSRRQALALLGLLWGSSLLCGKAGAETKTVRQTLRVALP